MQRITAQEIFKAGVQAVVPDTLIANNIQVSEGKLSIGGELFILDNYRNIYLVGAGKASGSMALGLEKLLGNRITDGVVIVKYGHAEQLKRVKVVEAGHPVPDENGLRATVKLLDLLKQTNEKDLVIALISGGGSSLLVDLPGEASLSDLQKTFDLLLKSGADIAEMNIIRKHLSQVKGGGLARHAYPSTLITLILSDVIGDSPAVIASGPTVQDSTTINDVWNILEKYQLNEKLPSKIRGFLSEGVQGKTQVLASGDKHAFEKVYNYVLGSNRIALHAACKKAEALGFETIIVSDTIQGEIEDVVQEIVNALKAIHPRKGICLLFGGEPTLKVAAQGKGGRNQHLALLMLEKIKKFPDLTFLSAGTDGTDGPTEIAGAVVDHKTLEISDGMQLDPETFLTNYDSFHFFEAVGGQIFTGPTKTNVMDLMLVLSGK